MATITTRAGKGSPLTNTEVDDNFSNLNSAKYESGSNVSFGGGSFSSNISVGGTVANNAINVSRAANSSGAAASSISLQAYSTNPAFNWTGGTLRFLGSGNAIVFNEDSSNMDFRVESNDNSHMLFVDASTNRIGVGTGSPLGDVQIVTATAGTVFNVNHNTGGSYPKASGIGLGATSTALTVASDGGTVSFTGGAGIYAENTAASGNPTNLVFWTNLAGTPDQALSIGGNNVATFASTISAVGSANSGSASHSPALLGSGNYGGGIATRDGAESGWYQQTSGADWHFYHNRTVASQTPESKKVLSFNSTGAATFTGVVTANAGVVVDNITIDGTQIGLSSGDLTIDVAGNTVINSDAGGVYFLDGAVTYATMLSTGAVFNEAGVDADFRIETETRATAFYVDADTDTIYLHSKESEAGSRFTINNDGSTTGHLQFQTAVNTQNNGYVRANIVMSRNKNQITWDSTAGQWYHAGGSSTDWSMLSHTSGGFRAYTGASVSAATHFTNTDFNDAYLNYYTTPTGGHTWEAPGGGGFVFNERGLDRNFRVESSGNANMLYVDGVNNTVGIGTTASVDETLKVQGEIRASGNDGAVRVDSGSGGYYLNLTQTYAHPYSNSYIQSVAGSSYHGRLIFEGNTNGESMEEFLRMSTPEGVVFNEDGIDKDFRVESDSNTNMLHVDGGNNSVGIGTTGGTTGSLIVQSNSGAGGISIIGRSNGGIGGISFYDDNGSTSVGYVQGRADNAQLRLWGTQSGGNVSIGQNNTERLRITSYGGTHARNGHLGSSYTHADNPDRAYWTLSTFNDNARVTSGTVGIYTSNVEWQPNLIRVTAASVDSDLTDAGSAVWYVRVNGYHGQGSSIGVVDSWTSGNMAISVTATDINQHHMRVNITVTGSGNRTVCAAESLSYGQVFETARTG